MKKIKATFHQPTKIITSIEVYKKGVLVKERMISFIPPENSYIKFGKDSWCNPQVDKVYLDIGESGDEIVGMDIYCKTIIYDISSREDVHRSDEEYREILTKDSLVTKEGWALQ